MQVRILRPVRVAGQHYDERTMAEFQERTALELIAMGKAERYVPPGPPPEPLPPVRAEADANRQRHKSRRRAPEAE